MRLRSADYWVAAALMALGILLGRIQTFSRSDGRRDPATAVVQTIVNPLSRGIGAGADAIADFGASMFRGRSLLVENRRLRALTASASTYDLEVDRLEAEVDSLRKMAGWKSAPGRVKIPADVIGYFPEESRIMIDVGTKQGIVRGMPVATFEGIVGRVETAGPSTAQVLLITAPSGLARISAVIHDEHGKAKAAGLMKGLNSHELSLEITDPSANVRVGDTVTTSGFSDQIPRGIVIGRVTKVRTDLVYGTLTATVEPSSALGELREVLVIR